MEEIAIILRGTVVAASDKEGFTHKATPQLVLRSTGADQYNLGSSITFNGTPVYLNIAEGGSDTVKVKIMIVGNMYVVTADENVVFTRAFNPAYNVAMQEGYSTAPDEIRSLGFGAGMGLPNMKRYTDDMKIESEVGVGTTVTMRVNL